MRPLNWLLKLFLLSSTGRRRSKTKIGTCCILIRNIITATILGFLNFYSLYYKYLYIYSTINISIKLTDAVQTIYDYCQYFVDIYFVYKYGTEVSLEYYKQYERIDTILNMLYYPAIKKKQLQITLFFAVIWLITTLFDFLAWFLSYGWITPLMYSTAYLFLLIKILTTIDLTSQVVHIEYRLRVLGNLVQDYYDSEEGLFAPSYLKGLIGDSVTNKNWFYCNRTSENQRLEVRLHPLKALLKNESNEVKWLSRCYLLLTEQCLFINKMYGIRILLNSLSLLIDMIRFTNIAVRIIIGSQHTSYDSGCFPAVSSILRMLTCAAVLISLVEHCERVYRQGDRIVAVIDHLLINKNPNVEMRAAMAELRGLVQARPISFSMANFFRLSYSLLVSTASVVVTYTIILLQSVN